MKNKQPPFQITNKILSYVAEIAELVGNLTSAEKLSTNLHLRRTNRIRTIHGALAIEQNTLTLDQVTAVLNGKHVPLTQKTRKFLREKSLAVQGKKRNHAFSGENRNKKCTANGDTCQKLCFLVLASISIEFGDFSGIVDPRHHKAIRHLASQTLLSGVFL